MTASILLGCLGEVFEIVAIFLYGVARGALDDRMAGAKEVEAEVEAEEEEAGAKEAEEEAGAEEAGAEEAGAEEAKEEEAGGGETGGGETGGKEAEEGATYSYSD